MTARSSAAGRAAYSCQPPSPATIVPWVIYERTGDVGLLARQLPSMRAWVDRMAELAGSAVTCDAISARPGWA